jgi:hypothetical protein
MITTRTAALVAAMSLLGTVAPAAFAQVEYIGEDNGSVSPQLQFQQQLQLQFGQGQQEQQQQQQQRQEGPPECTICPT